MRPATFTDDQIIDAGKFLLENGRSITGFALRQKIGGGNPNRLKQVWDEHLAKRDIGSSEELPDEVADAVARINQVIGDQLDGLAIELNDAAVSAADQRVQEVLRTAEEERDQFARELNDASQTVDGLETKVEELGQQLSELQSHSQAQAIELATTKVKAESAEQAHQEQRKLSAQEALRVAERLTKIEAERDAARNEAASAREDAAKLRGQVEALQAQAAELMRAIGNR